MSGLYSIAIAAEIATVTMNRPEARNALSLELITALEEAIARIDRETEGDSTASGKVRVMILAGAGKVFCAGMDLKGVLADAKKMGQMLHGLSRTLRAIRRLPIPTIARVQGAAIGGGCGLMVVTDFAITHADAKVGYPEVSLGVSPAVVAPWLMRKIGPGRARALLLAGGTMTGREGFELGLATHLAERESLDAAAMDLARNLAAGGPAAMAATKQWLNELDGSTEDALFEKAAEISAQVIAGPEAQSRLRKAIGE